MFNGLNNRLNVGSLGFLAGEGLPGVFLIASFSIGCSVVARALGATATALVDFDFTVLITHIPYSG